jgi:hypothetical protein
MNALFHHGQMRTKDVQKQRLPWMSTATSLLLLLLVWLSIGTTVAAFVPISSPNCMQQQYQCRKVSPVRAGLSPMVHHSPQQQQQRPPQPWSQPSCTAASALGRTSVLRRSFSRSSSALQALPWSGAAAMAATTTLASTLQVLHADGRFVLTGIFWLSAFGISLERRTVLGKALSAPLATMGLALLVANLGILPFSSPVCA